MGIWAGAVLPDQKCHLRGR